MTHRGVPAKGEPGCFMLSVILLVIAGVVALVIHLTMFGSSGTPPAPHPSPTMTSSPMMTPTMTPTRPAATPTRAMTPTPSPSPSKAAARHYTVRPGDTLMGIAEREYGMPDMWTQIYAANRKVIGPMPALIIPGQRLVIPILH
jgi:Tfp pilus assembly protein FimV